MRLKAMILTLSVALILTGGKAFGTEFVTEVAKLLASDGDAEDYFGSSVSISGDVALVAARYDYGQAYRSGSAYIFRWNGSSWVEEQKLLASDGDSEDRFGVKVSISGDVALVGAWMDEDNGVNSGSAYVYALDETVCVELQTFPPIIWCW